MSGHSHFLLFWQILLVAFTQQQRIYKQFPYVQSLSSTFDPAFFPHIFMPLKYIFYIVLDSHKIGSCQRYLIYFWRNMFGKENNVSVNWGLKLFCACAEDRVQVCAASSRVAWTWHRMTPVVIILGWLWYILCNGVNFVPPELPEAYIGCSVSNLFGYVLEAWEQLVLFKGKHCHIRFPVFWLSLATSGLNLKNQWTLQVLPESDLKFGEQKQQTTDWGLIPKCSGFYVNFLSFVQAEKTPTMCVPSKGFIVVYPF